MSDRYAVFGNPIGHSRSPLIHTAFAAQCAQDLRYEAIEAPCNGFAESVSQFAAGGGRGANVTVPFKEEAYRLANCLTVRARLAGAVNTLLFADGDILGDNTDGAGLLRDLQVNLDLPIAGLRVLLLGAGGAARGVLGPLLDSRPARLVVANRTVHKARALAQAFAPVGPLHGHGYPELAGQPFDLIINATSASLGGDLPALPPGVFAAGSVAYDMMYGRDETPFLVFARRRGATRCIDGLGMLVEQAAEAFYLWRGVRPKTAPVLAMLGHSASATNASR